MLFFRGYFRINHDYIFSKSLCKNPLSIVKNYGFFNFYSLIGGYLIDQWDSEFSVGE